MKNSLQELKGRFEQAEESVNWMEISESEEQKEERLKRSNQSLRGQQDASKHTSTCTV